MAEKVFSNRIKRANRSALKAICMPKSMVFLALAIVFTLSMLTQIVAEPAPEGYTIVNDRVEWENSYGKIVVFPHTSYGLGIQTQYANITAYIAGQYDFAFEFDNAITGKVYMWQNISHTVRVPDFGNITKHKDCPGTYTINYGFINSTWGWCNYIAGNGTEMYWEHELFDYSTNASGIRIFWNITGVTGWHTEEEYYYDWLDKTHLFEHSTYNDNHFYWIRNVNFAENELKTVKWIYNTPIGSNGKWQLWIKRSQDTISEALASGNYVKLDPWWDANYEYRYEIQSNATGIYVLSVNDTGGVGNGDIIWTKSNASVENKSVYCKVSGCATDDIAIANETDETPWENDTDLTGTNPTLVYDAGTTAAYHFSEDSFLDSTRYDNDVVSYDVTKNNKASGVFGKGITCTNANTDYVELPSELVDGVTIGSYEMWVNASSWTTNYRSLIGVEDDDFLTFYWGGSDLACYVGNTKVVTVSPVPPTNIWIHLAFTWDTVSDDYYVYINGTVAEHSETSASPASGISNLTLCSWLDPEAATRAFDGQVDELRFYNRTLSQAEIFDHYYTGINNLSTLGLIESSNGAISFTYPTLANESYTSYNYVEVNASLNENATCSLEWDDGTPTNESMTVTNADSNTYCWLNMTGLSDGEYLFTVYAEMVSAGLMSTSEYNITVDATGPTVIITSPSVEETSTEIDINFIATDTNLFSCYYSLDSGINTSIVSCANTTISVTSRSHTIEVYAHDSAGNIGGSTVSFTAITFNLAVYNATGNSTITDWHVYMLNGSGNELKRYTNNNTLQLNISDVPNGTIEMTIWKENYGNATFNFTNNFASIIAFERHIIGDNLFVTLVPANNSIQFADQSFTMNITIPNYAEGNASIWYSLNGTLPYILGCSNCTGFSRSITFRPGENVIFALINNSQHYLGVNNENKSHNITVYHSKYNVTFLDEMTNKSIDFTNKNGTLEFFCSDRTVIQIVTGTLHEFVLNCTGSLNIIKFKLFDPKGDHYRELIPGFKIGNLTFYMINTTPSDVVVNKITFLVTDASFTYQAGIMHFKKIILTEGQKDIIDTIIGSDGKVYANLIGGETYTVSVESADGTNSKTLGEYTVPDATTTNQPLTIIDVRFIPTTYNFIGTDISWGFEMDTDAGRIYAFYNDSTGQTNSIKFWIYNITNVSARTQMYYDSVSGQSHHLFQWDYVTNGNENDTYLGYLEIDHAIHGNITESRPIAKGGIFYQWLGNIGAWYHIFSVFIIVFVASLFGAKSAPIGAVILAIIAGFLFYIEWLPSIMAGAVRLTDLLMISLIALSILAMFIIKRRRT